MDGVIARRRCCAFPGAPPFRLPKGWGHGAPCPAFALFAFAFPCRSHHQNLQRKRKNHLITRGLAASAVRNAGARTEPAECVSPALFSPSSLWVGASAPTYPKPRAAPSFALFHPRMYSPPHNKGHAKRVPFYTAGAPLFRLPKEWRFSPSLLVAYASTAVLSLAPRPVSILAPRANLIPAHASQRPTGLLGRWLGEPGRSDLSPACKLHPK